MEIWHDGRRVCIEPDASKVQEIVKGSERFISPMHEPYGYSIFTTSRQTVDGLHEDILQFYLKKLRYAVTFADTIIKQAFRKDFYEFYGVDRTVVKSPEEMCSQLIFDSFVLVEERKMITACLSNEKFMFGHYISCCWDYDWNIESISIC